MSLERRSVLIPLVSGNNGPGPVITVEAGNEAPPPHPAELDPALSNLHDYGLYKAGQTAQGSLSRLALKPSVLSLAQRLRPSVRNSFLTITNAPEVGRLEPGNSRSAELGLALALLMHAGQGPDTRVIATGCLLPETISTDGKSPDVAVGPVGGIKGKIAALMRSLETAECRPLPERIKFFLPDRTLDGGSNLSAHAKDLEDLASAYREKGFVLEVEVVKSLREAAEKLGISTLAMSPRDRFYTSVAGLLLVAFLSAGLFWYWLVRPIQLRFTTIAIADGTDVLSPVRARYDVKQAQFRLEKSCIGEQGLPVYREGDSLVFRAHAATASAIGEGLIQSHFVLVTVSEESGIKVFPPETMAGARTPTRTKKAATDRGEEFDVALPISGPKEKNKLIVIARRLQAFDPDKLRQKLDKISTGRPKNERINIVVAHLTNRYPGYLDYSFLSTTGDLPCDGQ